MAPIPENRWGVFVTGLGEFTAVGSTANAAGFDLRTGGVTFGVDYRLSSNFAVGLLGGYAHTGADLANGGSLDADGEGAGVPAAAPAGRGPAGARRRRDGHAEGDAHGPEEPAPPPAGAAGAVRRQGCRPQLAGHRPTSRISGARTPSPGDFPCAG